MNRGMMDAREAMMLAVFDILERGMYIGETLEKIFGKASLDERDTSLVTGVVTETVKMKKAVDHVISLSSRFGTDKLDGFVRTVLRTAVAQLIYFDRLPAYAIVDTSVKLIKKYRRHFSGYVNAVLRDIVKRGKAIEFPDICTEASYEKWMYERWERQYGGMFARSLMEAGNRDPGLSLRVNRLKADPENVKRTLSEEGYETVCEYEETDVIVLKKAAGIMASGLYRNGQIIFQDEAAARVCLFIDPSGDKSVLDLCAAPGGKTFYMSQIMGNEGLIVARDISEGKVRKMKNDAEKYGIKNVRFETSDAETLNSSDIGKYDRVLADVPCTGTGIIWKKPEIKWNRKPEDIGILCGKQYRILSNAFKYLKNGGQLVYSTCSVEKEENEEQVERLLKEEKTAALIGYGAGEVFMKLYPNIHGTDGFFAAKIMKKEKDEEPA